MQQELNQLRQSHAAADDVRWLELYAQGCRWRDSLAEVEQVWTSTLPGSIADLTAALPGEFQDGPRLLARYGELERQWKQILAGFAAAAETGPVLRPAALTPAPLPTNRRRPEVRRSLPAANGKRGNSRPWTVSGSRSWRCAAICCSRWRGCPNGWPRRPTKAWGRNGTASIRPCNTTCITARPSSVSPRRRICREALILDADRDPADVVLRRTAALAADLRAASGADAGRAGRRPGRAAGGRRKIAVRRAEARYVLFADACRLRRQIAFANPLLNFDQLLFVKRHRAIYNHMCDQYYGIDGAARRRAVRARRSVRPGRRSATCWPHAVEPAGCGAEALRRLEPPPALVRRPGQRRRPGPGGGSFLSPDLSYDGRHDPLRLRRVQGRPGAPASTPIPTAATGREGRCYHHLQGQRRRLAAWSS